MSFMLTFMRNDSGLVLKWLWVHFYYIEKYIEVWKYNGMQNHCDMQAAPAHKWCAAAFVNYLSRITGIPNFKFDWFLWLFLINVHISVVCDSKNGCLLKSPSLFLLVLEDPNFSWAHSSSECRWYNFLPLSVVMWLRAGLWMWKWYKEFSRNYSWGERAFSD